MKQKIKKLIENKINLSKKTKKFLPINKEDEDLTLKY